jgi:hypothetical protein
MPAVVRSARPHYVFLEPVSNDFALTTEATERLLLSDTTSIWCKVI